MATVTVRWVTRLMWTCDRCGEQMRIESADPSDPNNTVPAVAHEQSCGSNMRAGAAPGWLVYEVVPPVGTG